MTRKSVFPFQQSQTKPAESIGGSKLAVEATAFAIQSLGDRPSLVGRIYAPVAVRNYDQDDPRYEGKSNQVENVYFPSRIDPPAPPRSGIAQIFNWLTRGKLE